MSRPSMSTGGISFNTRAKHNTVEAPNRDDGAPMHLAIIGDFSGRGSRGEMQDIATRRAIEVDKDNYEEVFSRLNVSLSLPLCDEPLRFGDVDDLHPDTLFNELSLFEKLRVLKRKLKNPDLFQQAADEILQWPSLKTRLREQEAIAGERSAGEEPSADKEPSEDKEPSAHEKPSADKRPPANKEPKTNDINMLDAMLARGADTGSTKDTVNHLIHDIVSPYIEAKQDPRRPEFEAAVEEAISHAMRRLMHSGAFQALEANWRELYFLVRGLALDKKLKLFIIDVSREELTDDLLNNTALEDSGIYKNLCEQYQVPGAQGFSLLQFNYYLEDDIDDLRLASAMANLANASGAVALGSVSEKLAGCASIDKQQDPADWDYSLEEHVAQAWNQVRNDASASSLALVAPRFLLRLPYGKKSSPIDSFSFEELGDSHEHDYYCWGNGATIISYVLAKAYSQSGWKFSPGQVNTIDDLPLHVYQDEDGDSQAKACAEIFMTDSVANKFAAAGILSLRSVKGQAAIVVPVFRSIAASDDNIFSKA